MPADNHPNMADTTTRSPRSADGPDVAHQVAALSNLLERLDHSAESRAGHADNADSVEDQCRLVQVRLGIASSLFMALRAKHPPTASHCLRVALGCSSWGTLI